MRSIDGWLEEEEAQLLIDVVARGVPALPTPHAVVEVGSYCGRATMVLGSVVQAVCPATRVYAIDPHDGSVGALDQGIQVRPGTLDVLQRTLADAGLETVVEVLQGQATDIPWQQPIALLLIDGLHDYAHVARDFFHFEPWLLPGGYVAFHDYAPYFPGVKTFVDELLGTADYQIIHSERSMIVLRKQPHAVVEPLPMQPWGQCPARADTQTPALSRARITLPQPPLVSCIMPTANRRHFVPQAIQYFLRQDYPCCELIVVDDGADRIGDVLPDDPRIRYLSLPRRLAIGRKRNLACQMARGSLIVHWDDDDWMAPWRLSYQVEALLRETADICGLDTPLLYHPATQRAWQYVHPRHARPWVYGATLCYTKAFWAQSPFPPLHVGEDTRFVWARRSQKIVPLPDCTFQVSIIHRRNVSAKRLQDARWRAYASETIRHLLGDDWSFYGHLV
jgi:hypothetical protein